MKTESTPLAKCVKLAMVYKADFAPAGMSELGKMLARMEALETSNAVKDEALLVLARLADDVDELADYDNPPDGWISKADSTLTAISSDAKAALTPPTG